MLIALFVFGTVSAAPPAPKSTPPSRSSIAPTFHPYINPIPFLVFGLLTGGVGLSFHDRFVAGPDFSYVSATLSGTVLWALGFGLRGDYALTRKWYEEGWRLSGFAQWIPTGLVQQGKFEGEFSAFLAGALVGYRWFTDGGFSYGVGAGAQYLSIPPQITVTENGGSTQTITTPGVSGFLPAFEIVAAWAF